MSLNTLEDQPLVDSRNAAPPSSQKTPSWVRHAIKEIQAGQDVEEHFGLLFRHYEPLCRSLLRSFSLRSDLDDVVQDVMLRLFRGIKNFRLESSFNTWLTRIVHNAARSAIRNHNTQKNRATNTSLEALLSAKSLEEGKGGFPEPHSERPNPLEVTLSAEREEIFLKMLQELPPRIRQCMLLYYVHGFTRSEIAQLQGTTVNTVKKQLADGRRRVRPILSEIVEILGLLLAVLVLAA